MNSDRPTRTVAFDFDGVLAQYDGWKGWQHYGEPVDGIKKIVNQLKMDWGCKIIIYTTRGNSEMAEWCKKHGILYTYINSNPDIQGNNPGKPIADVYVDDRAYTFDPANMDTMVKDIMAFEPWWKKRIFEEREIIETMSEGKRHDKRTRN